MIEYNANGSMVTPMMGRLAIGRAQHEHTQAAKFVLHPVQAAMIAELSLTVSIAALPESAASAQQLEALERATADRDMTFCGLHVEQDPRMSESVIELRDRSGSVIAKIVNLAVPK